MAQFTRPAWWAESFDFQAYAPQSLDPPKIDRSQSYAAKNQDLAHRRRSQKTEPDASSGTDIVSLPREIYEEDPYKVPSKKIFTTILDQEYELPVTVPFKRFRSSHGTKLDLATFTKQLPAIATLAGHPSHTIELIDACMPPGIVTYGARYVAACFWSWFCVLDELTKSGIALEGLESCIIASASPVYHDLPNDALAQAILKPLQRTVQMTTISSSVPTSAQSIVEEPWKPLFWAEVGALIQTLRSETSLQKTVRYKGKDKYGEGGGHWLDMRARSTAVRPLLIILRASLSLPPNMPEHSRTLCQALALQRDLLAFDWAYPKRIALNSVIQIMARGIDVVDSFALVLHSYSRQLETLFSYRGQFKLQEDKYLQISSGWVGAFADWTIVTNVVLSLADATQHSITP